MAEEDALLRRARSVYVENSYKMSALGHVKIYHNVLGSQYPNLGVSRS